MNKKKTLNFCLLLLSLIWSLSSFGEVWPIAPQSSSHQIEHGYGDFEGSEGFHDAIDIPAPAGTEVRACMIGVIREVIRTDPRFIGGAVLICESYENRDDYWLNGHIYDIPEYFRGVYREDGSLEDPDLVTVIPSTDFEIGKVSLWTGGGGPTSHIHFFYRWGLVNLKHPFDFLEPLPNMTPYIDFISFRKDMSSSRSDDFTENTNYGIKLYGDIDIIAGAHTDFNGNIKSGVNSISYEVKDSRGEIVVTPHKLMEFEGLLGHEIRDLTKQSLMYDSEYRSAVDYFTAQGNPYIVTNAQRGGVILGGVRVEELCWATKADETFNGTRADDLKASINGNAKFPDGVYKIYVKAYDYLDNFAIDSAVVLLDNYVPYVSKVMVIKETKTVYDAGWVFNEDVLTFDERIKKNVVPGDELKFNIYFSEEMDTTKVPEVKLLKDGNELEIKDNKKWIDKMTWEGNVTIPEDDKDWEEGDAFVSIFKFKDLAGHMLDDNPESIANRIGENNWERYEEGADENHELYIGEAPIVTSTDPSDRAKEVPVDKDTISIVFSKSMEQDITEEAFLIVSEKGDSVSLDVSWKDTITLEISPLDTLDYCMEYTCTIKDTVISKDSVKLDGNTDDDGEPGGDHVFTFATEPPDIKLDIYPLVENVEQGHPLSARLFAKGNGLKKEIDCNITYYLSDSRGWAVDGIDTEIFSLSSTV